jgi:hypothetical protein
MTEQEDRERGWLEYRIAILSEQRRHSELIDALREKLDKIQARDLNDIKTDVELLKFKAALWGSVAGTLFGGLVTALFRTWVH